jgi:hypothetical protein
MTKKITWKKSKRMTCEQNINARIAANRARAQAQIESDELRARLVVLTPDREKQTKH